MLNRLAKVCLVAALAVSLGLHWAFLQTVAWAGMAVRFSREVPIREAIAMTFDGKHPCTICDLVLEAHKAEQKKQVEKLGPSLDGLSATLQVVLFPPEFQSQYPIPLSAFQVRSLSPPVPPPRAA